MDRIASNIARIGAKCDAHGATLVAVTKLRSLPEVEAVLAAGVLDCGENRVQDMLARREALGLAGQAVGWHQIGTLQRNKAKYIAPFVQLVHSVESEDLLAEIDRQAAKVGRVQDVLLQVHIAREETKHGLSLAELDELLARQEATPLPNVRILGLMGMATQTDDPAVVRAEFRTLRRHFERLAGAGLRQAWMEVLSMGMSGDYELALEEGSTMVRVGSALFG